MLIVMLAVFE